MLKIEKDLTNVTNSAIINIAEYLIENANNDPLIRESLNKSNKSLEEMEKYIMSEARKNSNGQMGMESREVVYGWAQHYYDEDNITANGPKIGKVKEKAKTIGLPKEDEDVFEI